MGIALEELSLASGLFHGRGVLPRDEGATVGAQALTGTDGRRPARPHSRWPGALARGCCWLSQGDSGQHLGWRHRIRAAPDRGLGRA